MDAKEVFDGFLKEIKNAFPDIELREYNLDEEVKNIEEKYYPLVLKIFQRDESFFSEDRVVCGINLYELWKRPESDHELIWKNLLVVLLASIFHGDLSAKLGKFIDTAKNIWSSSGQENDEVSKILNDEHTEGHLQELLEYVKETRIAKLFMELIEETNVDEIASEINIENPSDIIDMIKNPDHPKMKNIVSKIQHKIQTKMQQGHFTQQQIVSEVEGIKAKIQGLFGNVINEMLGGRRSEMSAGTLMGNSPEARRQRMIARLQRKQREKNSR
jgi:hypothetical protein